MNNGMEHHSPARAETIIISGMHCASCAANIERQLRAMPGVAQAQVNYAAGRAYVTYDPARISAAQVRQVITDAGYRVAQDNPAAKATIIVSGMHCVSCAAGIEAGLKKLDGMTAATVNAAAGSAHVVYDPSRLSLEGIKQAIEGAGYAATLPEEHVSSGGAHDHGFPGADEARDAGRAVGWAAAFGIPLAYLAMGHLVRLPVPHLAAGTQALVQLALATAVMIAGKQFFSRGIIALIKTRRANMDTLIAVGTGAAYLYSLAVAARGWFGGSTAPAAHLYFETAGMLIVFILLGNWLSALAKGKASQAIRQLMNLAPRTATVLRDGREMELPAEAVVPGDTVIIKPGQKIPVDGRIVDGYSSIDESLLTGESMPADKKAGDTVAAGTVNLSGSFRFTAEQVGRETMLAQIIRLVEEAQGSRAPVQRLADRIAGVFVPAIIVIASVTFGIWLAAGSGAAFALTTAISVLIVACPCALGLATPTAIMVATGVAARQGILIRNADAVQAAESIDTVVFDKTGTLTAGRPAVIDVQVSAGCDQALVLRLAGALEARSEHPVARAVAAYAAAHGSTGMEPEEFQAVEGKGIVGRVAGKQLLVGSREFLRERQAALDPALESYATAWAQQGKTLVGVAVDGVLAALMTVADTMKPHVPDAVSELVRQNKSVYLLTGDNQATALAVARAAGIDHVIAGVLPAGKAHEIEKLAAEGHVVAMVGDGINDAPALAAARMGIAIGSGTDIAIEAADIVLVGGDVRAVATAIALSSAAMRKIRQNLFWAFFYNVCAIPLAAGVLYPATGFLVNPMVAAAAMAFSSVSVVGNSLLLRRFSPFSRR